MFFYYEQTNAGWSARKSIHRSTEARADAHDRTIHPKPETLEVLPLEHAGLCLSKLERLYPKPNPEHVHD